MGLLSKLFGKGVTPQAKSKDKAEPMGLATEADRLASSHIYTDVPTADLVNIWKDGIVRRYKNARCQVMVCENDDVALRILNSLSFTDSSGAVTVANLATPTIIKDAKGHSCLCLGGDFTAEQWDEVNRKS
jgi:hypothetical protein